MPSQLLQRLNPFFDTGPASTVEGFEDVPRSGAGTPQRHWPPTIGGPVFGDNPAAIRSVVIHETSGWTSYQSADAFVKLYTTDPTRSFKNTLGDIDGFGPMFYVDANGTAFQLIGTAPDDFRITWHATYMNGVSLGIENGDAGDANGLNPAHSNRFRSMPGNQFGESAVSLLLHPDNDPDAILIWFAGVSYSGSGDTIPGGWNRMLFTERDYRSLVLLSRFLAEALPVPRNFPFLPYEREASNVGNFDIFRRVVLADEHTDMFARAVGKTAADFNATTAALRAWYAAQGIPGGNTMWRNFLDNAVGGGFQGFLGHGFVGGGHDECPGPLFDWHRFAREVWDWWWYPFDIDASDPANTKPFETQRPYRQARRQTRLQDYYYDTDATDADYQHFLLPATDLVAISEKFRLTAATPVYALADGVIVAAQFMGQNADNHSGFVLTRHEVFHKQRGSRINYDQPPTIVYSVAYVLLDSAAAFDSPSLKNPDWLNRLLIRLKETELAAQLQTANLQKPPAQQDKLLTAGWNHVPSGGANRISSGDQIGQDAARYRIAVTALADFHLTLMPLEVRPGPTPVRLVLGDYLGVPSRTADTQSVLRVEIFSAEQLPVASARRARSASANEDWWQPVLHSLVLEGNPSVELPNDGVVWQYPVLDFLHWINDLTWTSEWEKYDVTDASNTKSVRPPKPKSRRM